MEKSEGSGPRGSPGLCRGVAAHVEPRLPGRPSQCPAQQGRAWRSDVPVAGAQRGQTSPLSVPVLAFEVNFQAGGFS